MAASGSRRRVPWATEAMRWLHAHVRARAAARGWPAVLEGPARRSAVAVTHDLDFLPGRASQTSLRLVKNVARPIVGRDPRLAWQVARASARAVRGDNPLDRLHWMIEREAGLGIGSSVNVLCRREHRRDANYSITEPRTADVLASAPGRGGRDRAPRRATRAWRPPGGSSREYEMLADEGLRGTRGASALAQVRRQPPLRRARGRGRPIRQLGGLRLRTRISAWGVVPVSSVGLQQRSPVPVARGAPRRDGRRARGTPGRTRPRAERSWTTRSRAGGARSRSSGTTPCSAVRSSTPGSPTCSGISQVTVATGSRRSGSSTTSGPRTPEPGLLPS